MITVFEMSSIGLLNKLYDIERKTLHQCSEEWRANLVCKCSKAFR